MAAAVIVTPGGNKVRSQSQRRFIVVGKVVDQATRCEVRAWVDRRTDSLPKARKLAAELLFLPTGGDIVQSGIVFDTVKGEFV